MKGGLLLLIERGTFLTLFFQFGHIVFYKQ